jgi:hypothetical protein
VARAAYGHQTGVRQYIARMMDIFEIPQTFVNTRQNELKPYILKLSPESREIWIDLHNKIEGEKGPNGSFAEIRGFAEKAAEQAARIAGILAVVDNPKLPFGSQEISANAMERGGLIIQWYLNETLRLTLQHRVPQEVADALTIKDWVLERRLTTITVAMLQQGGPRHLRRKERLDPALELLTITRHLRPHELATGKERSWRTNPETWT